MRHVRKSWHQKQNRFHASMALTATMSERASETRLGTPKAIWTATSSASSLATATETASAYRLDSSWAKPSRNDTEVFQRSEITMDCRQRRLKAPRKTDRLVCGRRRRGRARVEELARAGGCNVAGTLGVAALLEIRVRRPIRSRRWRGNVDALAMFIDVPPGGR